MLAGVAVYAIAAGVFPYHSVNHDEGVYLQQATLLLDGRLAMHAGELADAVRPWFFVEDGGWLYPKYQPYPAALFAVAIATVGEPRVALAAVAAANAALVYVLGAAAFDRRVGVVAAAAFAAAPMTLLTSAVFLPYAPTTTLNLAFAACYLRALRTGSAPTAALGGAAIGLAFFARPFTAVLFAAPFIVHAGWRAVAALRRDGGITTVARNVRDRGVPGPVRRALATAAVGLAFVGLALAYNAVQTGSPLEFPYAAFAPFDGPGFGHREIVGHELEYTPAIALEANALVVRFLLTRWGPAGLLGSALALAGLAIAARGWRDHARGDAIEVASRVPDGAGGADDAGAADERRTVATTAQVLLAGLFASIPLGNVAFWGNYNVLAGTADPTEGLVASFGPFYHFDLLAPLAIFAAAAFVAAWRWGRAARSPAERAGERSTRPGKRSERASERSERAGERSERPGVTRIGPGAVAARLPDAIDRQRLGSIVLAALVVTGLLAGGANAALLSGPLERNAAHTQELEQAYEPFEQADLENAVVFLPTPYGDWLDHPFQALRNEPGLDGPVVYAMDRDPAGDFEVVDAYPERTYHRYGYRGDWPPGPGESFEPTLQRLDVRAGERLDGEATVGVPAQVDHASVRLETDDGEHADYVLAAPNETVTAAWSLSADGARLSRPNGSVADEPLTVDDAEEVALQVRLVQRGASLTYRQEATVRTTDDGRVEALWPPERTVCPIVDDCGREGTYLPDRPDVHRDGVAFETELRAP